MTRQSNSKSRVCWTTWRGEFKPKKQYDNVYDAVVIAERMTKELTIPYAAYRCRFCGNYHVGRPSRWVNPVRQTTSVDWIELGPRAATHLMIPTTMDHIKRLYQAVQRKVA